MKTVIRIGVLALFLGIAGLFYWRSNQTEVAGTIHHWEFSSRYAVFRISAVGDSLHIDRQVRDLDTWASQFTQRYKSDGDLDQKVFAAIPGDTISLDSLAYDLFAFALRFREYSHGDIDVGIGNLIRAYKESWAMGEATPPDSIVAQHVADLKTPFYDTIPGMHAIRVLKAKTHFALGAFMEGTIMNEVERRLQLAHAKSWLIEVGGDFAYSGLKPDGSPWILGIKDPAQPEQLLAVIRTMPEMTGFCTSGDYEQQFKAANGKMSHHILDPHTGYSTQGKHSVSVSTSIPWMNRNTLCTWFMVLPFPQIQQVVEQSNGQIEALVVLDSNRFWISNGFKQRVDILLDTYQAAP